MSDFYINDFNDTDSVQGVPIVDKTLSMWTMLPNGKISKNLMVFFKTKDDKIYFEDFPSDNHNVLGLKLKFFTKEEFNKTLGFINISDIFDVIQVKKKCAIRYMKERDYNLEPCSSFQKKFCDTVYAVRLKNNNIYFIQAIKDIFYQ